MNASPAEPEWFDEREPTDIVVAADAAVLGALRDRVVSSARDTGAPDTVTDALALAVSELVTNVIQHAEAERLTVSVARHRDGWMIDVSGADTLDIAIFDRAMSSQPPDPTQLSGRGLFLVHAVMDTVELVDVDGHRHVRCLKRS